MIKTIIFDVGGVFKKMDFTRIYSGFAYGIGVSPEKVINYHMDNFERIILGDISLQQFWQDMKNIGAKEDVSYEDLWVRETEKNTEINTELLSIVDRLRKKYTAGVLSNVSHSRLFTDYKTDLYSHFDYTVFSCLEGLKKPDPDFYQIALRRGKAIAKEAIFIDDRKEFIDAAQKLGIKSILYSYGDNLNLVNSLEDLGVVLD